jgi:hypothetical protein
MPKKIMSEEEKEKNIKEAQERYNQRKPAITFRMDKDAKEKLEALAEKEGVPLGTFLYNAAMNMAQSEDRLSKERERHDAEVSGIFDRIRGLFRYVMVLMIIMPVATFIFTMTQNWDYISIFSIIDAVVVFLLFYFTLHSFQ